MSLETLNFLHLIFMIMKMPYVMMIWKDDAIFMRRFFKVNPLAWINFNQLQISSRKKQVNYSFRFSFNNIDSKHRYTYNLRFKSNSNWAMDFIFWKLIKMEYGVCKSKTIPCFAVLYLWKRNLQKVVSEVKTLGVKKGERILKFGCSNCLIVKLNQFLQQIIENKNTILQQKNEYLESKQNKL